MNENSKLRMALVAFVWLCILGVGVSIYKIWWAPKQEQVAKQKKEEEHKTVIAQTSSKEKYKYTINFGIDSFSGYSLIRSEDFKHKLDFYETKANLIVDTANYTERLEKLASGELDMAVFTVDSLIKASAVLQSRSSNNLNDDLPATIVAMVDETIGADAMVAGISRFPNIDSLNDPEVRIICTPDSPSETLARVIMSSFNLDKLPPNPFQFVDGPDKVFAEYQKTRPTDKRVFVIWEPYVSKIAANPDYRVLMDSGKFRGYIVDVIVARRGYLLKNEAQVENFIKAYLSTVFKYRTGMIDLVTDDAKAAGQPLKKEQAERLCKTIWWKNTQESYAHFDIGHDHGLQHMSEMISNITKVLVATGAITKDPAGGKPNQLYYDGILKKLHDTSWHPGVEDGSNGSESVRQQKVLAVLSDEEWKSLKQVGTLQVPKLVFARGTAQLTTLSYLTLDALGENLKTFPQYYLVVRGNVAAEGDVEANHKLAESRAQTAVDYLIQKGVDTARIRANTTNPNGSSTVAFVLGELPY